MADYQAKLILKLNMAMIKILFCKIELSWYNIMINNSIPINLIFIISYFLKGWVLKPNWQNLQEKEVIIF